MDLSPVQIRWIIQVMIILILSIAVHEFGHAISAHKLGDRLPQSQGRVTLNPLAHADPIGTLLFPLIGLVLTKGASMGFGWGRPVQVNPLSFSRRFRMRTGHMLVAAAGPAMNIVFGTFIAIVHVALLYFGVVVEGSEPSRALAYAVLLNFMLFFFNLIPAAPLDGGAVLEGLLPDRWVPAYQRFAPYGWVVLLCFLFIPELSRIIIGPALWMHGHLYDLLRGLVPQS